jgi:hypothetical protein
MPADSCQQASPVRCRAFSRPFAQCHLTQKHFPVCLRIQPSSPKFPPSKRGKLLIIRGTQQNRQRRYWTRLSAAGDPEQVKCALDHRHRLARMT